VVANDLKVQGAATGQLQGLVMAWDDFRVEAGTAATALDVQGRLLVGDLQFFGRTEWMLADDAWQLLHSRFVTQRSGAGSEPYFPTWLAADQGLSPNPLLTVRPKSSAVSYHFPANWEDPVYVPPPNAQGLGLKWELVRWADNP